LNAELTTVDASGFFACAECTAGEAAEGEGAEESMEA
jgi:hypothetical protein